jgi:spore coat protein U-like protein
MKFTWPIFALGILTSGLSPRLASATTASASFGVSATVQATCQATANAIAFKTYASASANTASPVSVTCSNSAQYIVSLSEGMGTGAAMHVREMTGSGTALSAYALRSFLRGIVNRGQIVGVDMVTGTDNPSAQVLEDYRQISAGQHVAADAYFDMVVVTVTY